MTPSVRFAVVSACVLLPPMSCRPEAPTAEDYIGNDTGSTGPGTSSDPSTTEPVSDTGTAGVGTGDTGPDDTNTGTTSTDDTGGTSTDDTGNDPVCGNGLVEDGELCDDEGESATCDADCTPALCGDDLANEAAGEACDGAELDGETCTTQGFGGGTLACDALCQLDTSACYECGDGVANPGEQCDGPDLGGGTCVTQGFEGGPLSCDETCTYDTSACYGCGDGGIDPGEQCDGLNLDGQTCVAQGFDGGMLACDGTCSFDTSGCYACGDGAVDPGEQCDGMALGGETCIGQGFDGGTLSCDGACTLDTSACTVCGDGVVDPGELCEGADLGGETCISQGFDSGALGCAADCGGFDLTGCGTCGNGIVDGFEICDDGNVVDGDGCPGDCAGEYRVIFVSSVMFDGDFGGLAGADAECQALATAAGLPGVFLAWLSTDTESPSTRMTQSTLPYVRPDGVELAPNWAGLTDGSLAAPIDVTETGGVVPLGNTGCGGGGFATVWSATSTSGTSNVGSNCSNWTSTGGGSQWGRADSTNGFWTQWCSGGLCSWLSPIYCVQQ